MHWGVRRFQYEDGSLTSAGRARYLKDKINGVTANVGDAVRRHAGRLRDEFRIRAHDSGAYFRRAGAAIRDSARVNREHIGDDVRDARRRFNERYGHITPRTIGFRINGATATAGDAVRNFFTSGKMQSAMESFGNRSAGAVSSALKAVKGAMNRKLTEISMKKNVNWGDADAIYKRSADRKVNDLFKPGNRAGDSWRHDLANRRYGETPAYKKYSNHMSGEDKHRLNNRYAERLAFRRSQYD